LQAEDNQPDFNLVNKLMIAKCFIALKNYREAEIYLKKTLSVSIKSEEDEECHEEARKLLDKINEII
jgi:hypothetical protein